MHINRLSHVLRHWVSRGIAWFLSVLLIVLCCAGCRSSIQNASSESAASDVSGASPVYYCNGVVFEDKLVPPLPEDKEYDTKTYPFMSGYKAFETGFLPTNTVVRYCTQMEEAGYRVERINEGLIYFHGQDGELVYQNNTLEWFPRNQTKNGSVDSKTAEALIGEDSLFLPIDVTPPGYEEALGSQVFFTLSRSTWAKQFYLIHGNTVQEVNIYDIIVLLVDYDGDGTQEEYHLEWIPSQTGVYSNRDQYRVNRIVNGERTDGPTQDGFPVGFAEENGVPKVQLKDGSLCRLPWAEENGGRQ